MKIIKATVLQKVRRLQQTVKIRSKTEVSFKKDSAMFQISTKHLRIDQVTTQSQKKIHLLTQ